MSFIESVCVNIYVYVYVKSVIKQLIVTKSISSTNTRTLHIDILFFFSIDLLSALAAHYLCVVLTPALYSVGRT